MFIIITIDSDNEKEDEIENIDSDKLLVEVDNRNMFTDLLNVQSTESIIDNNSNNDITNNLTIHHIPLLDYSVNTTIRNNNILNDHEDIVSTTTTSFQRSITDEYFNDNEYDSIINNVNNNSK